MHAQRGGESLTAILTDSTADLGQELAARHGIAVVPLSVHLAGRSYKDGIDLDPGRLFNLVEIAGELPKTAAPSVGAFQEAFARAGQSLFIGISSQLSATVQNAQLAAQELPEGQVRVIDSLNLSTGIGLLVLRAADLRDKGCPRDEIERAVRALIPRVRTSFVIETLEYLHKGGRCTALQALVGSVLKIRPIIEVRADGTMGIKERLRGARKKALDSMLADLQAHLAAGRLDRQRVFITHTGCDDDAAYLAQEIARLAAPEEIHITAASAVVSSHCGPGTIGVLYMVH